MKEIIWVVGVSAVGKETFCEYIVQNANPELLDKIGVGNRSIAVSEISKRATGKFAGDPIVDDRQNIPGEISQLLEDHDVVFVKWQFVDMSKGVFNEVEKTHPNASIKILLLQASDELVAARLLDKEWWQRLHGQEAPMQNVLDEEKLVKEQLDNLGNKYPLVTIHSDPDFNFH